MLLPSLGICVWLPIANYPNSGSLPGKLYFLLPLDCVCREFITWPCNSSLFFFHFVCHKLLWHSDESWDLPPRKMHINTDCALCSNPFTDLSFSGLGHVIVDSPLDLPCIGLLEQSPWSIYSFAHSMNISGRKTLANFGWRAKGNMEIKWHWSQASM